MPTEVTSSAALSKILSSSKDKLTIIDFWATWFARAFAVAYSRKEKVSDYGVTRRCGPCRTIAPVYEALSKQYPNVNFLKVDVDQHPDISQQYGVTAMPTFIYVKNGQKVDQVRGADRRGLEATLQKHAGSGGSSSSAGSFSGKGQTLGDGSASSVPIAQRAAATANGVFNLDPQLQLLLGLVGAYLVLYYLFFM